MSQKNKPLLLELQNSSKNWQKKACFLFFLFLILGLISFPRPAFAIAQTIANCILTVFYAFAYLISLVLLKLVSVVLRWVIMENFIPFSYTDPARNPIIEAGWGITRDFANMFFVIFLAFIGLATALRIKEYEFQKTLPKLIFIILIINFTPVICGLIVDASNILTINFLSESGAGGIESLREQMEPTERATTFWGGFLEEARKFLEGLMCWESGNITGFRLFYSTGFNIGAAFIYLIFVFIFLLRFVAIWLLVIISPIAFLFSVFPLPPGITVPILGDPWKGWWHHFLQWCFVGVTAAFFLFLGGRMMAEVPEMVEKMPEIPKEGLEAEWVSLLSVMVPYGISLLFMGFGAMASVQSAAFGAQYAIQGATKIATGALKGAKRGARRLRYEATKRAARGVEKVRTGLEERAAEKGKVSRAAGVLKPIERWTKREEARMVAERPKKVDEEIKRLEDIHRVGGTMAVAGEYTRWASPETKLAVATLLAREKGMEGLKELSERQRREAVKIARGIDPSRVKEIVRAAPGLTGISWIARELVDVKRDRKEIEKIMEEMATTEEEAIKRLAHRRVVATIGREKIPALSSELVESERFLEDAALTKGIRFFIDLAEHHPKAWEKSQDILRKLEPRIREENPRLYRQATEHPQMWAVGGLGETIKGRKRGRGGG